MQYTRTPGAWLRSRFRPSSSVFRLSVVVLLDTVTMSLQNVHVSSVSVSSVGRDVLWERTVASLPPPLLEALRSSGLDDPGTLVEYPRSTVEKLERGLGRTLAGFDALAPSGAASTEQITSTHGHGVSVQAPEWPGFASSGLDVCVSSGGDSRTVHASSVRMGGDPRTDHASFVGEALVESEGGDPKTDHASFGVVDQSGMAATCPPCRPGWLATTTANFAPLSPDCTESVVSRVVFQEPPDGFPSTAEDLDGLPISADSKGREHPEGRNLDSTLDCKSTVFTRILHVAEESERLRQSDPGVQIVTASRSPSELSAHQMGLSLAGTTRLKIEPIASTGILDIREPVKLSISDRALLRKFKSSGQVKENSQPEATPKQEKSTTVSRVDGHPPKRTLGLYDRMLLRKYPDAGTNTILSRSSSMIFSPPVAQSGESVKKGTPAKPMQGLSLGTRKVQIRISIQGCRAIGSFWRRHFTLDAGF